MKTPLASTILQVIVGGGIVFIIGIFLGKMGRRILIYSYLKAKKLMAIIEPVRQDPGNPASNKRFSSGIRLWHWANAIIISGSLITVLINSTLLDNRSNTSFIQTELQKSGTMLSADQAHTIAHAQSDEVWTVHQYFGYLLAAFFIYRLILEPFRPKSQRFFVQLKEAYNGYFVVKQNQENDLHDFVVQTDLHGFFISYSPSWF